MLESNWNTGPNQLQKFRANPWFIFIKMTFSRICQHKFYFEKKNWGKFGLRLLSKGKKKRRQGGLLTKFANDVDVTNRPRAEASIAANCQAVSRLSILSSNKNSSNFTEETRVQLHLTYEIQVKNTKPCNNSIQTCNPNYCVFLQAYNHLFNWLDHVKQMINVFSDHQLQQINRKKDPDLPKDKKGLLTSRKSICPLLPTDIFPLKLLLVPSFPPLTPTS